MSETFRLLAYDPHAATMFYRDGDALRWARPLLAPRPSDEHELRGAIARHGFVSVPDGTHFDAFEPMLRWVEREVARQLKEDAVVSDDEVRALRVSVMTRATPAEVSDLIAHARALYDRGERGEFDAFCADLRQAVSSWPRAQRSPAIGQLSKLRAQPVVARIQSHGIWNIVP